MSMVARFVQVTPALLATLIEDPAPVADLFKDQLTTAHRPTWLSTAMQKEGRRRSPQALASAMSNLDPRIRDALTERLQRLGVNPAGPPLTGKGPDLSLEKAWHGIHYLMCGEVEPGADVLSRAVLGGTEIGDDEHGYGPARYFSTQQVALTARELSRASLPAEMNARFDSVRMNSLGIYPGGWDTPDAFDWLLTEFHHLRDFYAGASTQQCAIVTCIV